MTGARHIDFVFFDAGGTLLGTNTDVEHWYEQFFVEACAERGADVTLEGVRQALHNAAESCRFERRCSTPEQVRQFWEHIYGNAFGHLLPDHDATELAAHYIDRFESGEYVQLFDDTIRALELVRERGIPMAVVSNFGSYLHHFLERTGIQHYFSFVLVSACEGCEKPHPEIFQLAMQRAGIDPARGLFVGDNLREDYEASAQAGLMPLLIDRFDRYGDRPDLRRVRRLDELARFIDAPPETSGLTGSRSV